MTSVAGACTLRNRPVCIFGVHCLRLFSFWHIGYRYRMGDWYRVVKTIKGHSYIDG